jgi:membrane glycosyltransferase
MAILGPADLMQSALQVLPYALQTGILILFGILFCWVSAGFWTALMGFLELLTGQRQIPHFFGASAGDEPIDRTQARTALVMPICNEDVDRVYSRACARPTSRWRPPASWSASTIFVLSDS